MIGGNSRKSITLLNYTYKSALLGSKLLNCLVGEDSAVLFIQISLLTLTEVYGLAVSIRLNGFNDISCDLIYRSNSTVIKIVLCVGIVLSFLNYTEYGIADGLLIGSADLVERKGLLSRSLFKDDEARKKTSPCPYSSEPSRGGGLYA